MVYKVTPVKENSILYTFQVDGMMSAKMNFLTPPHSYFFLCSLLRFCFQCVLSVGWGWGNRVLLSGEGWVFFRLHLLHLPSVASGNHLDVTHGGATAYEDF